MYDAVVIWLVTYLAHSTVLLGLAYLIERAGIWNRPRFAETVWRVALCGGLATASLQTALRESPGAWTPEALSAFEPVLAIVLPPPVHDAALMIALCWLVIVAGGLLHTGVSVYRLNASARRLTICDDPELLAFLDQLALQNGYAAPTVRISEHWASPLVLPNGDICVPEWIFAGLKQAQREAVLAHEVAHVIRHDPAWRIAAQLIARLGFLQPLHLLALRRLDLAAELSCDEWAARASGHRRELAEALYSCAHTLQAKKVPALTPAMTRTSTPLLIRIGSLLDGGSMFIPKQLRALTMLAAAAVAATIGALSLPTVAIDIDVASSRFVIDARSEHITSRVDGELVFTSAEDDVRFASKPLVISQVFASKTLSMEFTPRGGADLTRRYLINGKPAALDADGRAWLATAIPTLLRETGLNAAHRSRQLFDKGGATLLLAELERIKSSSGRSAYAQAFFSLGPASDTELGRALAVVGAISADAERKDAYAVALKSQRFSVAQLDTVLAGIASIESDSELSEALLAVAAVMPADPALLRHYRQSARKLGEVERGRVEKALDHLNV